MSFQTKIRLDQVIHPVVILGKRGRKRKNAETDPAQTANEAQPQGDNTEGAAGTSTEEQAAPGEQQKTTTKKPRRPVPEGFNTGVYTEEEEKKFLEALEMFGRDWNKVTAHIGTRDAHSIRSHAQKHFIKLYRDKIPLPEKVPSVVSISIHINVDFAVFFPCRYERVEKVTRCQANLLIPTLQQQNHT